MISLQYFATLLSRPHAGRYADTFGPKSIVVVGLCGCFLSGLSYLLAASASHWPLVSLALLCLGRVILGIGQSLAGTGSTLWGVGVVGTPHIGRVISWNGIVTYGAMGRSVRRSAWPAMRLAGCMDCRSPLWRSRLWRFCLRCRARQ